MGIVQGAEGSTDRAPGDLLHVGQVAKEAALDQVPRLPENAKLGRLLGAGRSAPKAPMTNPVINRASRKTLVVRPNSIIGFALSPRTLVSLAPSQTPIVARLACRTQWCWLHLTTYHAKLLVSHEQPTSRIIL
jgi:hypothetical protein